MQRRSPNNDECYTQIEDIEIELTNYWKYGLFENKRIICPCDLETSNFNIFLNAKKKDWRIQSITTSHYNPETKEGVRFQDIDYSKYDLCITNPPFSKDGCFSEFMKKMRELKSERGMDYIILTPFLSRVCPNVGEPLILRECYLGFGRRIPMKFINNKDGNETLSVSVDWVTSFNIAQRELNKKRKYLTEKKYDENNFCSMEDYKSYKKNNKRKSNKKYVVVNTMTMKDGTHPIRIDEYKNIPDDYYGWIFCPIGVLNVLSYDDFDFHITNLKGFYNKLRPDLNPFNHKVSDDMVDGIYHGCIIKKNKNI